MCNINNQTAVLLDTPPIKPPLFIRPLIDAYSVYNPIHTLNLGVYAEPYYGDYNNCSAVLLTHNPGQATVIQKGIGSAFETAILTPPNSVDVNYHNLSVKNIFPNRGTVKWINDRNKEINNLFNSITAFRERLFIRDLVPYHGESFGELRMNDCANYLYKYFFCQVIGTSFISELYKYLNRIESKKKTSILIARGSAWIKPSGLNSIGWDFIGQIYSNCYIYKANFEKIQNIVELNLEDWPHDVLSHDIYIMAITPKQGGRIEIYNAKGGNRINFTLKDIINNYGNINNPLPSDRLYINHSKDMDEFINLFRQ
jgi:hypothetical protein